MPTKAIAPITAETFAPFAKLGKSNAKIQARICDLLLRLVQTDDPAKVREICDDEIAWLENEPYKAATRTSYVTAYRKAIAAYFSEQPPASKELMAERKNTVKGNITQHCALNFMMAAPEDYAEGRNSTKAKTAKQRDNLTGFDAAAVLAATEKALTSDDWRQLAAGLIMAVQCRPSDILQAAKFSAVSKYRLEFTTKLKKRGKVVTGEIFCLVDTATFIDAFSRLRRFPDVLIAKDWMLKEVDSGKNSQVNRAVKNVFGETIPVPYGEKALSCRNLRAAGVNVAYWLYGRKGQSIGRFAELQLMHDSPGTAANYEDFYALDSNGDELTAKGIRKDGPLVQPQSEKRSSISLDAQLRDMIGDATQWGEGSHADRLERIIARALQADKLERRLALECEKRQKVEADNKRLQAVIQALADGDKTKVNAEAEAIAAAPVAEAEAVEDDDRDFWHSVPNDELNGDRRRDAYREKLRRSVEAVKEYNAGRELDDQFAITGSLLRQLTKGKPEKVSEWMQANETDLDAYDRAMGFAPRQNTGKPDPRSVIKWSESAYGAYDW